ncbi:MULTISPECIES: outer membrane beta-barrel protein [unclassified Imperialibacter]|uniref:outer membrane beta-barrel protein n=1 Tax=unclassified Imperialibacter TaxID=2629706 RepID=UPI00125F7FF6|nr:MULTISPECIES: outer membrane beta-barrel protein [unclassified Imperialibacter]
MKKMIATAVALHISVTAFCQLSGKLIDANEEGIPFANVLLLHTADSSLIKGAVSDESGKFNVGGIPRGQYFLRFSAVGFKTLETQPIDIGNREALNLGAITLLTDDVQLEYVVVRAEKPLYQQETDRTIVNVESSIMTKGSSALQVLERSPGVIVDRRDNNISFYGKSGVTIMLNGKLMRLPVAQVVQMLNGMSANNIEKIELITSPPARYDAEGNAGIINIVLKKNSTVGTHGSVSATAGYGWAEKATSTLDLSHGTGRTNFYGNYTFSHDNSHSNWFATGGQNMPAIGGKLAVDFLSSSDRLDNNHNLTGGFDTHLGTTTLRGNIAYNNSKSTFNTSNEATYRLLPDSIIRMQLRAVSKNNWESTVANLFLEKELSDRQKLNADLDYLAYRNNSPIDASAVFYDSAGIEVIPPAAAFSSQQKGRSSTPIEVVVAKTDYTNQFNSTFKLEGGAKATHTYNTSNSSIETLREDALQDTAQQANCIDMKETIGAIYLSFHWQPNEANSLQAGLRYEYSDTRIDADREENRVRRKISKFFPTFFYSRHLGHDTEVQLSFNKRISRPSYNDLASSLRYNDPSSVFTGNPALRPTITTNLKAGVVYQGYTFSALLSHDEFPIARYQLLENTQRDLMFVQPVNLSYQDNMTFQATLPFKIADWWTTNLTMLGGWRKFQLLHTDEKLVKTYATWSVNGSQTFSLKRGYAVELSGWYNAQSYDGSKKVAGFGMLNLGLSKAFDNNSTLQLSVTDLLKTMKIRSGFGAITREAYDLTSVVLYRSESAWKRIVKVTYTWSFGGDAGLRQRNTSADEERNRIRR